ncbi:MAG: DUF4238 domain-containing protein [Thermoleophilia bacterium]|nr:DUF4238 domain-containing protein [Thermoleophilia bacterium]
MTKRIKQHFIQRAHLDAWAGGRGTIVWSQLIDGRGWVDGNAKPATALAALPNYFMASDEFDAQWFENQFQLVENEGLPIIHAMRDGWSPIGPGNRRAASRYIAMSLLRSYGLREWNRQRKDLDPEQWIEEWAQDLPMLTEDQIREHADEVATGADLMRPIEMIDPLSVVYAKCEWYLIDAAVGSSFIVGDCLAVRIDNFELNEPGAVSGMGQSEFLIPLSPYRALLMVQGPESREWGAGGEDVMDFKLDDGQRAWVGAKAAVAPRELVELVNLCALVQSKRFVFADFDTRIKQTFALAAVNGYDLGKLRTGIELLRPIGELVSRDERF